MGLTMWFGIVNNDNNGDTYHLASYGKRHYPLHFLVEKYAGYVSYDQEVTLSKEILLKIRDELIDILQKATDGKKVINVDYVKAHLTIHKDEDIDDLFVGGIINELRDINMVLYYTDFDKEHAIYYIT